MIDLRVFELDVLLQGSLGPIALVAALDTADEPPLNFFGRSPEPFFALWRFAANIVLEVFCFFLN